MDAISDFDSLISAPGWTNNEEFVSFDCSNNRILKNDSSYNKSILRYDTLNCLRFIATYF